MAKRTTYVKVKRQPKKLIEHSAKMRTSNRQESSAHTPCSGPLPQEELENPTTTQDPSVYLTWSLVVLESGAPILTDAGKLSLGVSANQSVNIEGCGGGVFAYTDENGIKGTLIAMPAMDPEAFVHKMRKGLEQEYTYIKKNGINVLAEVLPDEEAIQ